MKNQFHWPCPNDCSHWMRYSSLHKITTNHHPDCEYVNDSLITVYRIAFDGISYVSRERPLNLGEGEEITEELMHEEIYNHLPEFTGY